jgi:hypothetical protein
MRHLQRSRVLQISGLVLMLAGLSMWSQMRSSSAALARPKPTPTPTAVATATPTPVPVTGTWQVVPSPAIDVSQSTWGAKLNAVAVVSATDVWAVGFGPQLGGPAYAKQTLIEHWDGTSWSIVPSPNPPSAYSEVELDGVFALAANDVWAVGYGDNPPGVVSPLDITVIEHWDGTSWSIVPSPNPDHDENQLHSIAGVASNDLWAVGGRGDGNTCCPFESLIEHWNGTSWSVVPNPGLNSLFGVSALATNNVWAVAINNNNLSSADAIIEHWDGTTWSNVSAPNVDDLGNRIFLRAIAAASASDIWAVGNVTDSLNNRYYSVTEHWNGTAWTLTGLNIQDSVLQGVAATGPANAWAVDGDGLMKTQHWDGATWSLVSTPDPGTGSGLQGVAAVSAGDIWAVGWTNTNGAWTPLIEQFT